jgi:hypothetical protein
MAHHRPDAARAGCVTQEEPALDCHSGEAQRLTNFLRIEPDLTMSKLRARLMLMNEDLWAKLSRGLRLGGLAD